MAVRGGGHSFSGLSTCDDGIVIDLGGLKSIAVDPRARTARAGGGVLWGEFDAATQAHGLHTPGGRVTTTGLGGFTTGGGYGWTSSKYGLACDNLVSAEVVLADGRVVRASEREHAARRSWTRSRRPAGAATRAESTCPGSATPRSTPSSATPPA